MNTINPNSGQTGNPESEAHPNSDTGGDNHPTSVDTDAGANFNRNHLFSFDSTKISTLTSLEQLQRYGATNAHLVNLGRKQLIAKGRKAFEEFNKSADEVDAALRLLGSSMQLFGSSVGVMHAIYQLRKSLLRLGFYFRENAAFLYEPSVKPNEKRYVCEVKPEVKVDGQINEPDLHKKRDSHKNEISGFHDELINQALNSFAEELNYRAGAFERLEYPQNKAFREHINELTVVFGQHLNSINQALKDFQKNSIPIIQRAQEHRGLGLQGLSAVAAFFSGITASAIQYQ
ncbi:hypothetical protein RSAG8_01808, partial [Rhizoctonia solani AG-8 WAC10335]